MKRSNNINGFSMIEMMMVVSVLIILALIGYPNLGRYSENTNRQQAVAMLSQYYALAKAASSEFLCTPGNFVTLGFNPTGQINSRILAASSSTSCDLPIGYPTKDECISTAYDQDYTEDGTGTECKVDSSSTPPSTYYSPSWQEVVPMNIIDENNDGTIVDEKNVVDTDNDNMVDNDKCPWIETKTGALRHVVPLNVGDSLEFRTLACLKNSSNDESRVVCICHNGIVGGSAEACSANDCKE